VRIVRALVGTAVLVGLAASARAQSSGPYDSSVYKEGPGFRLGSLPLTVHPGLNVELGYDSNVAYLPTGVVDSGLLRLRAHLDVATLAPQNFVDDHSTADPKIEFRLSGQAEYREYLSDKAAVRNLRSISGGLATDLTILPRGPTTLNLGLLYAHTVDPRNLEGTGQYERDYVRVGLLGSYRRGGFEVGIGDHFDANLWKTPSLKIGDSLSTEGEAYARLRFLPQTLGSLVLRAGYLHYQNRTAGADMIPVRVLAGAQTLFSTWFGAAAAVGYGNSLSGTPSFSSVLAKVELRFFLPYAMRISLGYDRDFYSSLFASYYVDEHLYAAFELPVFRRVLARAEGGVRFRKYYGIVRSPDLGTDTGGPNTRDDLVYEAHAQLGYRAKAWCEVGVSYNLVADSTSFGFVAANGTVGVAPSYIKHSIFASADFAY
jgi:hypothetical protein